MQGRLLAHLVINLCTLCTEAQTQALNSPLNIHYATTDLRRIDENKFSGNVDALGSLKQLEELCVAFSCCIVHSCLRDIKTIPESTSCPVRCLLLFASSAALCMTAKTMYYNETNLFTQWYPATRHAHQAPMHCTQRFDRQQVHRVCCRHWKTYQAQNPVR